MRLVDADKIIDMIDTKVKAIKFLSEDFDEACEMSLATKAYINALETLSNDIESMPKIKHDDVQFHIGQNVWLKFTSIRETEMDGDTR